MQRRHLVLFFASLAAVALFACSKGRSVTAAAADLRPLTVDQVAERIAAKDGKTFIYDDNPKDSWVKGHVPGATWLDEDSVTAAALPADKTATLIFYCHSET